MHEKNQIAGRARAIFRVLSGLTLAEGGLVFLLGAYYVITIPISSEALEYLAGHSYAHSRLLLCLIASASLLFGGLLLVAGALLWKLQRRGLLLLICVFITEFIFVLSVMGLAIWRGLTKPTVGFMVGAALLPFYIQVVTVFPILAGILISFAYRYQRVRTGTTE